MDAELPGDRRVQLVIPCSRSSHLAPLFVQALGAHLAGDDQPSYSIAAINDSPDDADLARCLRELLEQLQAVAPCELLTNERELGLAGSVNRGLQTAMEQGRDAIVLRPGAIVSSGSLAEMRQIAYLDAMIGFVCPRSNDAGLCSLPQEDSRNTRNPSDARAAFQKLSPYLPRFQFVPIAVGPCWFIKWEMLAEFGLLDESYSGATSDLGGDLQEHDFIMRANRCGYRVALANRAWIYYSDYPASATSIADQAGRELLDKRYPEYQWSIQHYRNGDRYQAERLLKGLLPDREGRLDLLFDCSSIVAHHNGTFALSKEIISRASAHWNQFNLYVMASEEARRFHQLDAFEGIQFVSLNTSQAFAIVFRFVQPFSFEDVCRPSGLAAVNVFGMLDPIMLDCLYLNSSSQDDLETLWRMVFSHSDGVVYISDAASDLFHRRFQRRPGLLELTAYPSLEVADYKQPDSNRTSGDQHILVIGNQFEHKRVKATVDALSQAFPQENIVAIGNAAGGRNVIAFESGTLSAQEMHRLFFDAKFVVFPSAYEGFGFPVLESLAHGKPILARAIPVIRAIREKLALSRNVILFSSTSDLIQQLKREFPIWVQNETTDSRPSENWDATTSRIGRFLWDAVAAVDFENVLLPRVSQVHLLRRQSEGSIRNPRFLARALEDRELQLRQIRESWSWRLTSPIRWLGSVFSRSAKSSHSDSKTL
jgi:glycosyltransferase involved in cell wall biosynthesis